MIRWKAVLRDTIVIVVLELLGGGIIGLNAVNGKLSLAVVERWALILYTVGFTISACLAKRNRLRHLIHVAISVWIFNAVNIVRPEVSFVEWLFSIALLVFPLIIGWFVSFIFVRTPKEDSQKNSRQSVGRALDERDIGKVFVRVDSEGERDKYLYLRSLGNHPPAVASFVTFRVTDGAARAISDIGYFNGQWYQEVRCFSEEFLTDIRQRYEQYCNERLRQIEGATVVERERTALLRARLGKPETWISLGDGPATGKTGREYVVWFNPVESRYVVEIYGEAARLLTVRNLECSHEPRFGIDTLDYDKIYGINGVLAQLLEQVEKESNA